MVRPGGTREPLSRSWFKKRERESMSKEVYRLLTRTRKWPEVSEEVMADVIVYLLDHEALYLPGQISKINDNEGWP
jgi:hypothetical protein